MDLFQTTNLLEFAEKNHQSYIQASPFPHLELWKGHQNKDGEHVLDECVQKVLPVFNRMVIFNTTGTPYHGHPEPLMCPEGWSRKSIVTYYYTAPTTEEELNTPASSTIFVKRPGDPDDRAIDNLRKQRQRGRVTTNVDDPFITT